VSVEKMPSSVNRNVKCSHSPPTLSRTTRGEQGAKQAERARVLGAQPQPTPAVGLDDAEESTTTTAREQQPADRRRERDGLLVDQRRSREG
jgi:hypothetical protein